MFTQLLFGSFGKLLSTDTYSIKSVALDEQMVFVLENITKSTNNLPRGLKPDCAEAHMKTGIVCKASPWG